MDYTKYIDQGIMIANEFVKAHGQQAWETVLFLTKISAWNSIMWYSIGLITFLILWKYSITSAKRIIRMIEIEDEYCNTNMNSAQKREKWKAEGLKGYQIAFAAIQGIGLFISFLMTINLISMWLWIQAFYPELYLAKIAINKVLN